MMKKVVTLIMAFVSLGIFVPKAHADGTPIVVPSGQTIYYYFDNDHIEIRCPGTNPSWPDEFVKPSGDLVIPDSITHNGIKYPVTIIGLSAFEHCVGLTSVTIPNTVTVIKSSAFEECTGLVSVTIGDSVTTIQSRAFYHCSAIASLNIPNSVTSIGISAFCGCSGLDSLTIPDAVTFINEASFYGCSGLTSLIIGNSVVRIDGYAFAGCSSLTSLTIPNSVRLLTGWAFRDCTSLTDVVFNADSCKVSPYGYGGISDNYVFYGCSNITNFIFGSTVKIIPNYLCATFQNLTSVVIPNSVKRIEKYAFYSCTNLDSITIPNSVTYIGPMAFLQCSSLTTMNFNADSCFAMGEANGFVVSPFGQNDNFTTLNIGSNVKRIPDFAFTYCTELQNVNFPASLQYIGEWAFYGTKIGGNLVLGNNVSEIGEMAFSECDSIISVVLPNGLTSISYGLFAYCSNMTSVVLPESIDFIDGGAFAGCSSLETITLPGSVDSIGGYAFWGCSGLTKISSRAVIPPALGAHCFDSVNTSIPLYVPCASVSAYQADTNWNIFSNITCAETYTITVNSADSTMGSVTVNGEASVTVEEGETVTLMATANEGYHFVRWNDNDTNATRTVTVTSDTTFTAYFEADGGTHGIDGVEDINAKVYVVHGHIVVEGVNGDTVSVFDIVGRQVKNSNLSAGVYLVKIGSAPARKVVVTR